MKRLAILAVLVYSVLVFAQNPAMMGTITGKVLDPSGAAIPGVRVTVTGAGSPVVVFTNGSGTYTLRLAPGTYAVKAELTGFASESDVVSVESGKETQLPLRMSISSQYRMPPSPLPPQNPQRRVDINSDRITVQGATTQYRGNVRMTTESIELRADELDFDGTTQTASVRGNVVVRVLPASVRVIPLAR